MEGSLEQFLRNLAQTLRDLDSDEIRTLAAEINGDEQTRSLQPKPEPMRRGASIDEQDPELIEYRETLRWL